jgi:hypothetical protein
MKAIKLKQEKKMKTSLLTKLKTTSCTAVVAAALLATVGNATANCNASSCGPETLGKLYTDSSQTYIMVSSGQTPSGCTPVSGYMTLRTSHANYNAVYAMLLTAFTANQPVFIRTSDGSSGCSVVYVSIEK